MDFKRVVYDRWTSLGAGLLAMASPRLAATWRYGREMYRTYAAGEASGNNQDWRPRKLSGETENKRAAKWLTARVRDQVANNGFIAGGIEKISNNVVRRGIRPAFNFKKGKKPDESTNTFWLKQFLTWARFADVTGHDSLWGLQRLAVRHMWMDGQFLIHRVYDNSVPGVVPLRLEMLEIDMLNQAVDGRLKNNNIARRGIELDGTTGRPVAYHILKSHPGDYLNLGGILGESERIPAEDIIHVWDRRRISQYSGISWLAAIVMEAYDMSEYRNNERQGAKVNSAFAAFVKTAYPEFRLGSQLPAGGQASPTIGTGDSTSSTEKPTHIEAGRLQYLPDNTDVVMATNARPGSSYEPFVQDSLRGQSAGMGMSYEAFSNNYTGASWSSARAGSLEERLSYQSQQFFLNEKMNDRIMAWFFEAAFLAGMTRGLATYAREPHVYLEMVSWQEPGWAWVDPRNEATASKTKLDNVLDTRRRICARQGEDWDEILAGRIEEEKQLAALYDLQAANQKKLKEIENAPEKNL